MAQIAISSEDAAQIREYLTRAEALGEDEPEMYADIEHDTEPTEEWTAWNEASEQLLKDYQDVIGRSLLQYLQSHLDSTRQLPGEMRVGAILRELLEDAPEVTLAPIRASETFSNHAFMTKSLNEGILALAMGESFFRLTPQRKGRSNEEWKLTASADACSRFLTMGGNGEIIKDVVDTVYTLIKDPQAEKFLFRGRIWITVNTILQEMLRTKGGTSRGRNKRDTTHEKVDAALLVATGAQIVGTDPSGNPTNTLYMLDGVRREVLTYKKHEYKSVWGFAPEADMTGDYAIAGGYGYSYPLLDQENPLTIDQAWIDHYLKDALNAVRAKLYTAKGNPSTKTKTFTIKRSWDKIFKQARPLEDMTSRQKLALVRDFEAVLTVLAKMDAHDELREGRPMYIRAYSERDGQRGRGKGAWLNLVIEGSTVLHTPEVDLTGTTKK